MRNEKNTRVSEFHDFGGGGKIMISCVLHVDAFKGTLDRKRIIQTTLNEIFNRKFIGDGQTAQWL